ncbi:MAG: hypothetical protein EOM46_29770, partial [Gammaproteobacteria bacterium]|nr:hypothetical protein [Gammaproteobacteria bacterium]
RTDGESAFVFVQNFTAQTQTISLPEGYELAATGADASGTQVLQPWDCRIVRRKA